MAKRPSQDKILAEFQKRAKAIGAEVFPVSIGHGTPMSPLPHVFISHSGRDRDNSLFQALLRDLESFVGVDLWLDDIQIQVGDSILERIRDGIRGADFILHIISRQSSVALWPRQEFELAYSSQLNERRAKILPIKIDDGPTPSYLSSLRVFDLASDYSGTLRELALILTADRQKALVTFGIDASYDRKTVIDISDQVGRAMIEHFAGHPEEMRRMDRRKFEEMVAELFGGLGYRVELTAKTRDGGRDIIAIKRAEAYVKYLIECKRPDPGGYVGVRPVRELYGVKVHEGATKAILATTAYFSPDALLFFEDHEWELEPRDYEGIVEWIEDYLRTLDGITIQSSGLREPRR